MTSKKEFGRLSDAEMKRIQALAVMLKSFFSLNLGKKARRFIAKLLVYSQVLQLATVVVIPNPGSLNPYLSTVPNHNSVQVDVAIGFMTPMIVNKGYSYASIIFLVF